MTRPSHQETFFAVADVIAKRASCPRLSVGCVITLDNRIVSTGYNGAGREEDHCVDVGCEMEAGHCVRAAHAEENAVYNAAYHGVALRGAEAYVSHTVCNRCRRALKSAGVVAIHENREYSNGNV